MKKFLSVALAAVMMLSLAACGSSSNKAESSSEGGSASDKTYIIATDTTFAPFEFTNDKNEFVGIDVDILAAIAKDQGFKYDLQSLGFDAAVAALESGSIYPKTSRFKSMLSAILIISFFPILLLEAFLMIATLQSRSSKPRYL